VSPEWPPLLYMSALGGIELVTLGAVLALGSSARTSPSTDVEMVLLGAAFLLVETTKIAELARLFGATWLVTGVVLAGIFVVLVVANAFAAKVPPRLAPLAGLLAAGALLVPLPDLLALPLVPRAAAAAALAGVPLGLGGVAFSRAFAAVPAGASARALGANLAGAALGGGLEALALVTGLRALSWIAAALYAAWAVTHALAGRRVAR
jgi:hypothetical protein